MTSPTDTAKGFFGQEGDTIDAGRMADFAMNFVRGWASVVALPIEIMVRPQFCTRYFHPVTGIMAWLMVCVLGIAGIFLQPVMHAAQHIQSAPFGTASFLFVFYGVALAHSPRIWRRIQHMELEAESHQEGPPLPIFDWLPRHDSWVFVRLVYEPSLIFALALALYYIGVIEGLLAIYFLIAAAALEIKGVIRFYDLWSMLRDVLDGKARAQAVQTFVNGSAGPESAGGSILASLPRPLPSQTRPVRSKAPSRLSPEAAAILSDPDDPEPGPPSVPSATRPA